MWQYIIVYLIGAAIVLHLAIKCRKAFFVKKKQTGLPLCGGCKGCKAVTARKFHR